LEFKDFKYFLTIKNRLGFTSLNYFVNLNKIKYVEKLLNFIKIKFKENEIINIPNNFNNSPIHISCLNQNIVITKLLIKHNSKINLKNKHGNLKKNKKKKNIKLKNKLGNTPLHISIFKKNLKLIKLLIKNGADLSIKNNKGNTSLHLLSMNHFFEELNFNNNSILKMKK
jgi:ankyrin repeat protein